MRADSQQPSTYSQKLFKPLSFFVYSNLFIAFCVAAYTAKTSLLLYGNNGSWHVNSLVFGDILLFYCFHRINKKKFLLSDENKEDRNNWMLTHKSLYYSLIAISLLIIFSQLFYMPLRTGLIFIPVGLLGVGYTFPVIPTRIGWKRLRDIYWLKTLWIAFAFSWLTTFLPIVYAEPFSAAFKPAALFILGRSFLFIFAICIPFDIRDMNFDRKKGVHTLPILVGVKTSIYIAIALLLLFISLVYIQFLCFKLDIQSAYALFLSAALTIILLPIAKAPFKQRDRTTKPPALLFPLLYDGAMLMQWILLIAFTE